MFAEKLTFASALLIAVATCIVVAEVDTGKPDLSIFNLRHVNPKELARERAGKQVKDLSTGAIHMHQSLIVSVDHVKCPAYAHLFKLIKNQGDEPLSSKAIRQDVIESLALVVANDRSLYFELFERNAVNKFAYLFIEAALGLEKNENGEAAMVWLDLHDCMKKYMTANGEVYKFLQDRPRQNIAKTLAGYRSVPVEEPEGHVPQDWVLKLANRFNKDGSASAEVMRAANELIESLDDEETSSTRQRLSKSTSVKVQAPADQKPTVEQEKKLDGESIASVEIPDIVELVVPDEVKEEIEAPKFKSYQLAILRFIRTRLEEKPRMKYEPTPRLSMKLAMDFESHWNDLVKSNLDQSSEFGREAMAFREDSRNAELAEHIQKAINKYVEITELIGLMKSTKKYESFKDYSENFAKLTQLLDEMDPSFDIDDLRRIHSVWKAKSKEYSTLNKFINMRAW